MEDIDDSITSSPTQIRKQSSKRARHRRNREKSILLSENSVSQLECETTQNNDKLCWLDEDADRLDCLRALQEPLRPRAVPASENFMSLELMLASQQLPQAEVEEDLDPASESPVKLQSNIVVQDISQDCCSPEETKLKPKEHIVEQILKDFCSSPGYEKDEPPLYNTSPQFRYYNKQIRTYSRCRKQPMTKVATNDDDDDERMSCSSGLSVQEDVITQIPTVNHCDFDANSSQRICENLLNLSAFFTQNNVNSKIDLPADTPQTEPMDDEDPQDATDILNENGYLIGNTEQCQFPDDINEIYPPVAENKEDTLFGERPRSTGLETPYKSNKIHDVHLFEECANWFTEDLNTQSLFLQALNSSKIISSADPKPAKDANESKEIEDIEFLDEIPFSEWQPMDIPNSTKEMPKETDKQQLESNFCNQLEEIPLSEWQPIYTTDSVEFRTASNKTIEVSEEQQKQALKLMSDLDASDSQKIMEQCQKFMMPNVSDKIEFRTASNKTVKLTDEMRKRAATLMADLEVEKDCNQLENESGFRTASNKSIQVTEQMQKAAKNLMADLEINILKREEEISLIETVNTSQKEMDTNDCSIQLDEIPFSEWQPMDIEETVEFKTASKKLIVVSDERKEEAAKLMADVKKSYSQTLREVGDKNKHSEEVQFRTASNKKVELTEEMQKRADMLMADLKTIQEPTNDCNPISEINEFPEEIKFRTASNKYLELTEEMRKKAAMLMADLERVDEPIKDCTKSKSVTQTLSIPSTSPKEVKFRTASNKTVELTEEMRKKAAKLMADLETISEPINGCKQAKISPETIPIEVSVDIQIAAKNFLADIKIEDALKPNECDNDNINRKNDFLVTETPQTSYKKSLSNSMLETPKCTQELQDSLTQLSERSPLDNATKSSIITRRNLLSLNKRRKLKRNSENVDTGQTPIRPRFNTTAIATSTPVPNRRENINENAQCKKRSRRSLQETPRVHEERVNKRRSGEALSPISAPTNKTRRLGLSRLRNKSSNDL